VNKQYRLINEVIHGASARYDWMTVLDLEQLLAQPEPRGSGRTASTSVACWARSSSRSSSTAV